MHLEFEKYINKINIVLRLVGMCIDKADNDRTTLQRFKHHWKCSLHINSLNYTIICKLIWLMIAIISGESLENIIYILPCVTQCLLGLFKLCSFVHHIHLINHVVESITKMGNEKQIENETDITKVKTLLRNLSNVIILLLITEAVALTAFFVGPIVSMVSHYYSSGEIKLYLPFLVWAPYDIFNVRIWPFIYFYQMWSAWVAVLAVFGPDCVLFICCTFIHIHFIFLQRALEQVFEEEPQRFVKNSLSNAFKKKIARLVTRHRELIKCVQFLEISYCKSALFNVITSSVIICATGFHLLVFKNYVTIGSFGAFLVFGMSQVFFFCYYGDSMMRSSMGVGDAVYNSCWYEAGATERKYLLTVLLRSQKPCKLTANAFFEINLETFTRVLSTSWSYFALLQQMDHS